MPITVIDPGEGSLARALGGLGEAIALRATEKQRREKQLAENPALLAQLAPGLRAAQQAGAEGQFLEALGVTPAFGAKIASFQPTVEEIQNTELMKPGNIQTMVQAEVAKARAGIGEAAVSERTSKATLEAGLPEKLVFNQMQQSILSGRTAEEALKLNQPFLDAIRNATNAQVDVNKLNYEDELVKYRRENGVDISEIKFNNLKNKLGTETTQEFQEWFESQPQGSHARTTAMMAIANPGQLAHMQFEEGMSFQERMARLEAQAKANIPLSVSDRMKNTLDLRSAWADALDNAAIAMKDGDKALISARAQDIENISRMIQDAQNAGVLLGDPGVGTATVNGKRIVFAPLNFTPSVSPIAENLWEQGIRAITPEIEQELKTLVDPNTNQPVFSTRDIEALKTGWQSFSEQQGTFEQAVITQGNVLLPATQPKSQADVFREMREKFGIIQGEPIRRTPR